MINEKVLIIRQVEDFDIWKKLRWLAWCNDKDLFYKLDKHTFNIRYSDFNNNKKNKIIEFNKFDEGEKWDSQLLID